MRKDNKIIKNSEVKKYIRKSARRVWCSGCGNGIVFGALIRAIIKMEIPRDKIASVSGIGCNGRAAAYFDWDSIQTPHGRPIPVATGIKLTRPDMHVVVFSGDGDLISIGGNHFIHAARRNIDLTVIVVNNFIYGMTGGQIAPTTHYGDISKTTPYGNLENHIDICSLAVASGATYVSRSTTYNVGQLISYIQKGIRNKGFSVIEVVSQCPTQYGKMNKKGNAPQMLKWIKENSTSLAKFKGDQRTESSKTIITGEFQFREQPELSEKYQKLIAKFRND
jgi:2-oxoglutarate ferredoxin oxidoreductase subunit beta